MSEIRRPIAVDLFAGAGGLSLGFEQAGFDIVAAVELDPIHAAIHELNFPYSRVVCEDVRKLSTLTPAELRDRLGIALEEVDVVIGGPPCQGFSLIGHRVLEDPRNSLVFEFVRIVEKLQPRTLVMENVPGMASGGHGQLLRELIESFKKLGYKVREPVQILNAAHFGVPQDRRRLFLLGARNDVALPDYPEAMYLSPNAAKKNGHQPATSLRRGPTVADAFSDLPDVEWFEELTTSDRLTLPAPLAEGSEYAARLHGSRSDPDDFSYRRASDPMMLTGCLRARHTDLSRERFSQTIPGTTESVSRFFRLPHDGVSNTLRAGTASDRGAFTAPRPIHPVYPRCITVREAARLHSFPDWFRFHRTIWHGFRQIGNSVPPLLGRAVGAAVAAAIGFQPQVPVDVLEPGCERLAFLDMGAAAAYFGVSRSVIPQRNRTTASGPRRVKDAAVATGGRFQAGE